jgi:hypothetical protein
MVSMPCTSLGTSSDFTRCVCASRWNRAIRRHGYLDKYPKQRKIAFIGGGGSSRAVAQKSSGGAGSIQWTAPMWSHCFEFYAAWEINLKAKCRVAAW